MTEPRNNSLHERGKKEEKARDTSVERKNKL
jgi:hypothetical protein